MGATMSRRRPVTKRSHAKVAAARKETAEQADKKHVEHAEKKHKKYGKG